MKRMVDFNTFARWYFGDMPNWRYIAEQFMDLCGANIWPLIDTMVELEVQPNCNGMYDNWINGEIMLESVDNYFECQ